MATQTSREFIEELIQEKINKNKMEEEYKKIKEIQRQLLKEQLKTDDKMRNCEWLLVNENLYIGGILNKKLEGKGTIYYKNRNSFDCYFTQGIANGAGQYYNYLQNSLSYCKYENGIKVGYEEITYDGKRVEICWENEQKVGLCQEFYKNGYIYVRQHKDDDIQDVYRCEHGKSYNGKSETNSMWNSIGKIWKKTSEDILNTGKRSNIPSILLSSPFILAGTSIGLVLSISATVVGIVASPIIGAIDYSNRKKNEIKDLKTD